jgi:hypothetical protein
MCLARFVWTEDLRCGGKCALDVRYSKRIRWRGLHYLDSAGPPREGGWPARLVNRKLGARGYIRDGLRGIAASIRRPKMLAVASHLALLPAVEERIHGDDFRWHVLRARESISSEGWGSVDVNPREVRMARRPGAFAVAVPVGATLPGLGDVWLKEHRNVSASDGAAQ